MSGRGAEHADLGPELRALAQAIVDRLDPAVRAAAARATDALRGPGRCQQVWCPVCALAALVTGDEHPLLTVIAEHSVTLMTVIRTMVDPMADPMAGPDGSSATGGETPDAETGAPEGADDRYHRIPIVVESTVDVGADDPAGPA